MNNIRDLLHLEPGAISHQLPFFVRFVKAWQMVSLMIALSNRTHPATSGEVALPCNHNLYYHSAQNKRFGNKPLPPPYNFGMIVHKTPISAWISAPFIKKIAIPWQIYNQKKPSI
jgi:hypothetical protein